MGADGVPEPGLCIKTLRRSLFVIYYQSLHHSKFSVIITTMRSSLFSLTAFSFVPFALAAGSTAGTSSSSNSTAQAKCYNFDGSEAPNDAPCGTGEVVNCCNAGDICMSNGLCMQQRERGLGLARGSCTDHSWGRRCYAPCCEFPFKRCTGFMGKVEPRLTCVSAEYNRDGGMSIVNIGVGADDQAEYCCGGITIEFNSDDDDNEAEIQCQYGSPFTIPFGTAIPNVAGLSSSNTTSTTTTTAGPPAPHRISTGLAIALGIGLPLGLALMGGILWAVWERRRRNLQRSIEEEGRRKDMSSTSYANVNSNWASTSRLIGLHDRYGPVPSLGSTLKGTPYSSAVFHSSTSLASGGAAAGATDTVVAPTSAQASVAAP
ncbi:uncharacterized protein BDV17DRAFT_220153 [Aspergillus undulatus]|uniref:uncharacterized protein n=1 Tax=Aspergillus undulatus TaxID=1810928 RepID=UPI003CCCC226